MQSSAFVPQLKLSAKNFRLRQYLERNVQQLLPIIL